MGDVWTTDMSVLWETWDKPKYSAYAVVAEAMVKMEYSVESGTRYMPEN